MSRARRLSWILPAAGLAFFLLVRLTHPIHGLGNNDVAGIAYNAEVLLAGGLPYVDTVEFKSPGAFFAVAVLFELLGREAAWIHLVCALGLLVGAVAVWLAARTLYGDGAVAVLFYFVSVAAFGSNYSSWMMPAYAWAFTCLILALRRNGVLLHVLAGACAALAFLLKAQAIVLAPLFPLVWFWGRRRCEPGATGHAWWAWAAGAGAAWLPLLLLYSSRGAMPALIEGVFPIARALEYTGGIESSSHWAEWLLRIAHQNFYTFRPATTLAVLALLLAFFRSAGEDSGHEPVLPQASLWLLALVSAGLGGMRYYAHYLVLYAPGLALLAAHPSVYRWMRARRETRARRLFSRVVVAWCAFLLLFQAGATLARTHLGYDPGDDAIRAGREIARRTQPDDTIFAWGWTAWPVYFWSGRRAPTPLYKSLGTITDFNPNGLIADRPLPPMRFKPGPEADRLVAAFRTDPPRFVVRAVPFFPGIDDDPLDGFAALREILERQYVAGAEFGPLRLLERRSLDPPGFRE